jgi:hypothetical protein
MGPVAPIGSLEALSGGARLFVGSDFSERFCLGFWFLRKANPDRTTANSNRNSVRTSPNSRKLHAVTDQCLTGYSVSVGAQCSVRTTPGLLNLGTK